MSINSTANSSKDRCPNRPASAERKTPALHRLGKVRRREGISRSAVSRRLGVAMATVERQECESTDLPLSVLYAWQNVLGVPLVELLAEPNDSLSTLPARRAQLVRLMKTALSISEQAERPPLKRLAQTLIDQLIEIMPELRGVNSWHDVGRRRRRDEYGRAAEHSLPDEMFLDHGD